MTKEQLTRKVKKILAIYRRKRLTNRNVSILSNNCWGGLLYDYYGIQYQSPTIGQWMSAKDYLKFLGDIDYYFCQDMIRISYTDSHVKDLLLKRKKEGRYSFELDDLVIGRLGSGESEIDVIFLHYHSFEEAKDKWNKRKTRVNKRNLLVKYNDQNGFTRECFERFAELPYKNKLFFTSDTTIKGDFVFYYDIGNDKGHVINDYIFHQLPFDITEYINDIQS